ncbi:MAG: CZB domain-containing protein [Bacteroidales bacterium]|nr:CZB domain-containing protein [Bacteroidales bacterium]
MTKEEIITEINKAKNAHVLWFANAMALSTGTDPGDSSVPKRHTECAFGKWYYGTGQENNYLESYKAIEGIHKELHNQYNEIFKQFKKLDSEGFFEDITLRDSAEQLNFNITIDKLKDISLELLEKLTDLQAELK